MSDNRASFIIDVSTAEGKRALVEMADAFRETGEKAGDAEEGIDKTAEATQRMARAMAADQLRAMADGFRQLAGAAMDVAKAADAQVRGVSDAARDTRRWAEAVGATAEQMEALGRVGTLAGGQFGEVSEVGDLIQELGDRYVDAANGNEAYAQTFKRLGVSLRDGKGQLRDQVDVFLEVNDKLASMTDNTEAMALAGELMTDIGRGWVASLRDQGVTLTDLMQRMGQYGTLTAEQRATLREYERATAELEIAEQRLAQTLAASAAPALTEFKTRLAEALSGVIETNPQLATLIGLASTAGPGMLDAAGAIANVTIAAKGLGAALGPLAAGLGTVGAVVAALAGGLFYMRWVWEKVNDGLHAGARSLRAASEAAGAFSGVLRVLGRTMEWMALPTQFLMDQWDALARKAKEMAGISPSLGFVDTIGSFIVGRAQQAQAQLDARERLGTFTLPPVMPAGGGGGGGPVRDLTQEQIERARRAVEFNESRLKQEQAELQQLRDRAAAEQQIAAQVATVEAWTREVGRAKKKLADLEGAAAGANLSAEQLEEAHRTRVDEARKALDLKREELAQLQALAAEMRAGVLTGNVDAESVGAINEQVAQAQDAVRAAADELAQLEGDVAQARLRTERAREDLERETRKVAGQLALTDVLLQDARDRGDWDEVQRLTAERVNLEAQAAALTEDPADDERAEVAGQRAIRQASLDRRDAERKRREEALSTAAELARAQVESANLTGTLAQQEVAAARLQGTLRDLAGYYYDIGDAGQAARYELELLRAEQERQEKLTLGQEILAAGGSSAVEDMLRRQGRLAGFERQSLYGGESGALIQDRITPSSLGESGGTVGDAAGMGRRVGAAAAPVFSSAVEAAVVAAVREIATRLRPGGVGGA